MPPIRLILVPVLLGLLGTGLCAEDTPAATTPPGTPAPASTPPAAGNTPPAADPAAAPGKGKAKGDHPKVQRALRALNQAITDLQDAGEDFGDHKADAIKACEEARDQLKAALAYRQQQLAAAGPAPAATPAAPGAAGAGGTTEAPTAPATPAAK